ncbi:MAG: hypothetical protein AVDCRST_MAG70-1237 [uncultured Thermomicrobiales bacterium]|uniref:Uncharacterized protein n=1 Tax=uncultured Thermomicrobiales bacterium TaxID=1645740 RepID=A0A6J4UMX0_9BACT|nr:MAG: hypothetical protein AVDCRST_MAG70-1237 [uncultured Thermomicrobiales bacterium]
MPGAPSDPSDPTVLRPLTLSLDPALDRAAVVGWEAWEAAAAEAGSRRVVAWLLRRIDPEGGEAADDFQDTVETLLGASDPDDRVMARAELAEFLTGHDDLMADTLWDGVLSHAEATGDGDMLLDAIGHLAAIAEDHGDPLAAAEYHLAYLAWRRQPDNAGDPEDVQATFEEVIRLAERDGARAEAALFEFRLASFTRLAEADDPRASEGDWEADPTPYPIWA